MITIAELLKEGEATLSMLGISSAKRDTKILLAHLLGCEVFSLRAYQEREINEEQRQRFDEMIVARGQFQPVSQIIGGRYFWKNWFKVTRDVLDPRPETEMLVEEAIKRAPQTILDLGTGSGAILLSILAECPEARGVGSDISSKALEVAKENALALNLVDRVTFLESNWFQNVTGSYDLIISNPPYISEDEMKTLSPDVLNWEPHMALSPGGDGLESYRHISTQLGRFLNKNGCALFEIGHLQASDVVSIFYAAGFKNCSVQQDLNKKDRMVTIYA